MQIKIYRIGTIRDGGAIKIPYQMLYNISK